MRCTEEPLTCSRSPHAARQPHSHPPWSLGPALPHPPNPSLLELVLRQGRGVKKEPGKGQRSRGRQKRGKQNTAVKLERCGAIAEEARQALMGAKGVSAAWWWGGTVCVGRGGGSGQQQQQQRAGEWSGKGPALFD